MRTPNRLLILAVTCATTVALTACGTSAQPIASGAISTASPSATGSSPAASPTPTPTSTPTPTPKPTKAAPSKTVLGPFGLGPLTLGMSPKEAKATGLVGHVDDPTPGCTTGQLKGASGNEGGLYFSSSVGLAAIYSHGSIATPQGIKLGSTYAQVHAAYPKWSGILDGTAGRGLVKVPGNSAASYRIDISDSTGKVMSLALQAADQDCYE